MVQFHSDIRSDKIEKLKNNSKAAMLFYDKEEKIQVRLKVECLVNHNNNVTKESWKKTQHISRRCYLTDSPPPRILNKIYELGFFLICLLISFLVSANFFELNNFKINSIWLCGGLFESVL